MELFRTWIKEDGPRLQGSRNLDSSKLLSPCIVRVPTGGYRSRIFVSQSADGLMWGPLELVLEGAGYGGEGLDAVHTEDMSLIRIAPGRYRM